MTETDRRNYRLAILFSLVFHGALLFAYLPSLFSPKAVTVDMLPIGVVEIAPGSGKPAGDLQVAGNAAVNQNSQPVSNITQKTTKTEVAQKEIVKKPEEKTDSTNNVVNNKTSVENNKTSADKDNSIATNKDGKQADTVQKDNSQKDAGQNEPNGANTGTGEVNGGDENTGTETGNGSGSPMGLGTGEGKVSRMGTAPPYPKNAMNEGKEGEVGVRILVLADGGLEQVNLQKSSGDDRLDRAALTNIEKNWKFAPESQNYYIDLIFVFSIKKGVSIKFVNSQTRPG